MRIPFARRAICSAVTMLLMTTAASAQISNKPFQFNTPGTNGVGMSTAGRQAILNQELFGATPNVLVRGADGNLVSVARGPGRIAIVTGPGGEFLPGFRRSFRSGTDGARAGAFNAFFVPEARSESSQTLFLIDSESHVPVDTWTGRVLTGSGEFGYGHLGPVNIWTGYVYRMGPINAIYQPY